MKGYTVMKKYWMEQNTFGLYVLGIVHKEFPTKASFILLFFSFLYFFLSLPPFLSPSLLSFFLLLGVPNVCRGQPLSHLLLLFHVQQQRAGWEV